MDQLAINGGTPVRTKAWPTWPVVDESDVQAVADIVRSGRWASNVGPVVSEFEKAFAEYNGARHGIAVNSGSSALQVALAALDIGPGDEVIVPSYTYIASANAVLLIGATPVQVDVEADTYNIDPAAVERAITPRTKAIIAVHFSGSAVDFERLLPLAQKHNIAIVEDAAHSHGGRCDGKALGTFGKAGCFSFQASKNLNSGEGGIILTDDDEYARICRMLMSNGRIPDAIWYQHFLAGATYRMTEMQAALLRSQLRRLEEQTRHRDSNGRYLDEELSKIVGIEPMRANPKQELHPHHLYMFRFNESEFGMSRSRFLECLIREGVPASPGYAVALHQQPIFSGADMPEWLSNRRMPHWEAFDYSSVRCPNAERACAGEAVWFNQSMLLAERQDMEDIVQAIAKIRASVAPATTATTQPKREPVAVTAG